MIRGLVLFSAISILWGVSAQAVNCHGAYYDDGTTCSPNLPNAEFHPDASNYPVCGQGRVALSSDGTYAWSSYASSGKPRWNGTPYTYDGVDYSFTSSYNPNPPIYGFPPDSRCYCLGKRLTGNVAEGSNQATTYTFFTAVTSGGGLQRQYPVTNDVISTQDINESVKYGPVAIAKSIADDGRLWANINGESKSSCGCPNVNEEPTTTGPDTHADAVGTYCKSMVSNGTPVGFMQQARVLAQFDPGSTFQGAQVMSSAWEVTNGTTIVSAFQLPTSGSSQDTTTVYQRKMWTCAAPFELNPGSGACEFIQAHHACDNGTGGGPASPVVEDTNGATDGLKFDNIINRKLACCLNAFHSANPDPYEKFDCIGNAAATYASFDDLWSKADAAADGGQINAIILADSIKYVGTTTKIPRIISGFYSMTGQHCDQFSEFAYPAGSSIKHYRVDPVVKSGQQTSVGAPVAFGTDILVPSSTAYGLTQAGITGTLSKTVPSTPEDYRACPILVRAAILASCPSATVVPNALTSILPADGIPHCAVAGGIQIHVRIEQLFEITGTPPIKPVDTFIELNQTTSIDVTKLILDKVGDQCPPSTTKSGDRCIY